MNHRLEREGYLSRIGRLLTADAPLLPDFDGARIASERRYKTLLLPGGLRAFRQARTETIAMLRSIRGSDWGRSGRQEGVGALALHDVPRMMVEHDASHRAEIDAWLRARSA